MLALYLDSDSGDCDTARRLELPLQKHVRAAVEPQQLHPRDNLKRLRLERC